MSDFNAEEWLERHIDDKTGRDRLFAAGIELDKEEAMLAAQYMTQKLGWCCFSDNYDNVYVIRVLNRYKDGTSGGEAHVELFRLGTEPESPDSVNGPASVFGYRDYWDCGWNVLWNAIDDVFRFSGGESVFLQDPETPLSVFDGWDDVSALVHDAEEGYSQQLFSKTPAGTPVTDTGLGELANALKRQLPPDAESNHDDDQYVWVEDSPWGSLFGNVFSTKEAMLDYWKSVGATKIKEENPIALSCMVHNEHTGMNEYIKGFKKKVVG